MKRWQWAVLLLEITLMALILVLPQVDLPDFLSHGMATPVAVKTRVSTPPVRAIQSVPQAPFLEIIEEKLADTASPATPADLSSRLSVLCSRIC